MYLSFLYFNDNEMDEGIYNLMSQISCYMISERMYYPKIPVFDENEVLNDFDKFKIYLKNSYFKNPILDKIFRKLKISSVIGPNTMFDIQELLNSNTTNGLFLKACIYQYGLGVEKNIELAKEYYIKIYANSKYKDYDRDIYNSFKEIFGGVEADNDIIKYISTKYIEAKEQCTV
jgi:hypothetical protein